MSEINVFNKQSHQLDQTVQSNTVSLTKASVVVVHQNLDDIVAVKKDKSNVILVTQSGEEITLVNYFNEGNINTSNRLVLQDDQNRLIWAKFTDQNGRVLENIEYGQIEDIEVLYEPSSGFSPWLWVAVPVVGAGIYLLADGGNKSDAGDATPDKNDGVLAAPKIDPINGKDPIKGKAEAGSVITITFPNGDKKTATADSAGNWSVENPGLKQGDIVNATASNKNGNVSETAKQEVDTVAPTLKISVSDVNLSAGKEVEVTFTFSEAVKDFDLRSITVTGGTLAKLSSKDNKTWTAIFTQKGSGDPSIKVADDQYSDLAGNKGKGDSFDKTSGGFHTDFVAPILEISASKDLLSAGDVVTITFKFSKAVKAFELEDISVTGGQISGLSSKDNITWTAIFTQKGGDLPSVKVTENSYTDEAGNQGKGAILDQNHGEWGLNPTTTQFSLFVADTIALDTLSVHDQAVWITQQPEADAQPSSIKIADLLITQQQAELLIGSDFMDQKSQSNDQDIALQRFSDQHFFIDQSNTAVVVIDLLPQHDLI